MFLSVFFGIFVKSTLLINNIITLQPYRKGAGELCGYLCVPPEALNPTRSDVWGHWTAQPRLPPPKPWYPHSLKHADS